MQLNSKEAFKWIHIQERLTLEEKMFDYWYSIVINEHEKVSVSSIICPTV